MPLHAFVGSDWGIWGAYGSLCIRATIGACDGYKDISSGGVRDAEIPVVAPSGIWRGGRYGGFSFIVSCRRLTFVVGNMASRRFRWSYQGEEGTNEVPIDAGAVVQSDSTDLHNVIANVCCDMGVYLCAR